MAAALTMLFFFLHIFTASALESATDQELSQRHPHLTGCVSANMETFRCRWKVGTSQGPSELGDLRLFYINKKSPYAPPKEWSECPHYSTDRPNECFFNENHTTIWTSYRVQLRSRDQAILYDEKLFSVSDIVQPDPPVSLNWTLLNVSVTSTYYDIILSWKPPKSADVAMGWMTLQYEIHYRDIRSDLWKVADNVKSTHCSLYGLQTNVNHEVRVRCRKLSSKEFGEFSDSIFVHIPSKVSEFPMVVLPIFGILCLVAILTFVIISQQEKLMVILLPPVPGPKIRGIDPELLKTGKLRELTSILGSPPDLRPELYNNDPWMEFIDLDIEEQSERLTDLDTDCLMHHSPSSKCAPLSASFKDNDSGRASCCDPDLPSDQEASPFHPLIPNQSLCSVASCSTECEEPNSPTQSPSAAEPPLVALGREALYTQVSEVKSSGEVLLTPEELTEGEKTNSKDTEKDDMAEKRKEGKGLQLRVVNPDHQDYTSEPSPTLFTGDMSEQCEAGHMSSFPSTSVYETNRATMPLLPPAPVYTMVEGVDRQISLLLTQNSTPAPHLMSPKTIPTPGGYLTPDLLGSITP